MQSFRFTSSIRHTRPLGRLAGSLAWGLLLGTMSLSALGCAEDSAAPTGPGSPVGPDAAATVAATYTIKDLGTLGGTYSAATAINNVGSIVGSSTTGTGAVHAFLYRAGVMRDL